MSPSPCRLLGVFAWRLEGVSNFYYNVLCIYGVYIVQVLFGHYYQRLTMMYNLFYNIYRSTQATTNSNYNHKI